MSFSHFQALEQSLPETNYNKEFLADLMDCPHVMRNVAIVGHLHHGKVSNLLKCLCTMLYSLMSKFSQLLYGEQVFFIQHLLTLFYHHLLIGRSDMLHHFIDSKKFLEAGCT